MIQEVNVVKWIDNFVNVFQKKKKVKCPVFWLRGFPDDQIFTSVPIIYCLGPKSLERRTKVSGPMKQSLEPSLTLVSVRVYDDYPHI